MEKRVTRLTPNLRLTRDNANIPLVLKQLLTAARTRSGALQHMFRPELLHGTISHYSPRVTPWKNGSTNLHRKK